MSVPSYSLIRAVREGRVQIVRKVINTYGLSYSPAWSNGYTLLCDAIQCNRTEIAKLLLEEGCCKVNSNNHTIDTPLHFAVSNGNVEFVEMLLSRSAYVNAKNKYGQTPLHNAIKNEIITELLLNHGADVDATDNDDDRPLHVAVEMGCAQTVELLLKHGADVNSMSKTGYTPLHIAVERRTSLFGRTYSDVTRNVESVYSQIVQQLLEHGANINCACTWKEKEGYTPLHLAAKSGYSQIVQQLLKHGANVNCACTSTFKEGYTPLHLAAETGNEEIINLLLSSNAQINTSAKDDLTPLHIATENGHEKTVKLLLDHGANVDAQDKNGKTILRFAVEKGHGVITKYILKYCPDVNNNSNRSCLNAAIHGYGEEYGTIVENLLQYGFTIKPDDANKCRLLHDAVQKGFIKIVDDLLKYGADVNKSIKGYAPLHIAINNKQEEVAKLLINNGADVNAKHYTGKTLIFYAIKKADLNMTKLLLKNEAIVKNSPELLNTAVVTDCIEILEILLQHNADVNAVDRFGNTALHYSCRERFYDNPQIVKLLLSNGANVNAQDMLNKTALILAIENEHEELVEALLDYNADVNILGNDDITPLHVSAQEGNPVISKMLLNKGANVNAKENNGITALHLAAEKGYPTIIKILVKFGADIDSTDVYGRTALHIATKKGHVEVVEALVDYNADVNIVGNNYITPLHISAREGNPVISKILLNKGANVNAKQKNGITALHLAAEEGCPIIIKTLLKFGADIDSTDVYGRTALHIASTEGHVEVVTVLLDFGSDINIVAKNNFTPLEFVESQNKLYFHNSDDDNRENYTWGVEIASILKQHIAKMKIANLYLSEKNSGYSAIFSEDFQNECEKELENLHKEKINCNNVSFHDILTKSVSQLAIYARNENIVQVLKSDDYKMKFPIYASMINSQFRKGLQRRELLEQGITFFHILFHNWPELPYNCIEQIFSHLNNTDLRIFVDSCKSLKY